jgi:phosphate transport system substrate-binding protein
MSPHPHFNIALVDKIWNLKRLCESELKVHIPLNMILKDDEYRAELLETALQVENPGLTRLVWEIRQMEDRLISSHSSKDELQIKRKSRYRIRLNYLSAFSLGLLIFLLGYLLRSFLPLEAGSVFVLEAIANTQIKPALVQQERVKTSGVILEADKPLFRLHGSNTLGEKLTPRLVEAYLMAKGASQIKTKEGSNPGEKIISGLIGDRFEFIEIHAHGSGTAFTDLANHKTDIGMSSRRIKSQERETLLPQYGDLQLPENELVVGLDGLAIITHSGNPIASLSISQIVKIFSGEITNWSELGWKDLPITLYARDEKSGTWDSFKSMVLEPAKAQLFATAKRYESSSSLSDDVAKDPGAIGFIGLPYVRRAKLIPVSSTKNSLAVLPNHFTVGTEDYLLSRRLYFYSSPLTLNTDADEFLKFVATERAQSIVEDVGFVSQNIKVGEPFDPQFYPEEMRQLIAQSQRLSLNFRFKDGSDQLDNKALQDLDRLTQYVEQNSPMRVQLFGFSDSEGDAKENSELSERRAKVVEDHLISRGIFPLVAKGMGEVAPLASSKTEEGRRMNRRVEVWLL